MAMSAAEKQRRYREKRKQDSQREAAYKQKHKERNAKRKKITDMNPREQRRRRREWRSWDTARRQKKAMLKNLPPTPPSELEQSVGQHGNRSRGRRAVRRDRAKCVRENKALTKQLQTVKRAYWRIKKRLQRSTKKDEFNNFNPKLTPSSKMKQMISNIDGLTPAAKKKIQKSEVARALVFHNAVVDTLKTNRKTSKKTIRHLLLAKIMRKYRLRALSSKALGYRDRVRATKEAIRRQSKVKKIIEAYFNSDDVSRATAGKKETVTKGKVKMQKRWLLEPMTALHSKFITKHGRVSYATFARYRPFYVCPPSIDGRDTCLCQYHVNMNLLVMGLKKLGIVSTRDTHTLCHQTVCDKNSFKCCYNLCDECKDRPPALLREGEIDYTLPVSWDQWGTTTTNDEAKKPRKVTRKENFQGTLNQLVELFKSKMIHFKKHIFNIRTQNVSYKQCKTSLDKSMAVFHIDYSENYDCKYNEEVQSHHFGGSRNQVSLQTGVLYTADEPPLCFGTVCANTDHSPAAIWAHLQPLLELLKKQHPLVNIVHFFSDGPTTQYRQKKNFYLFRMNVASNGWRVGSWSFFEASHGKGPADGVGGTLKRAADSLVGHGSSIPDARSFYDQLKDETKVQLFFIESEEIDKIEKKLPQDLQPVKNTRSVHQVIAFPDTCKIKHRAVSCYCDKNDWNAGFFCDCNCEFSEHLLTDDEAMLETSSSESSDQDEDGLSLDDKSSDFDADNLDSSDDNESIIQRLEHPDEMKPGVFMLVRYKGGPRNATTYHYVGVCQSFDEEQGEIEVMFLKLVGEKSSLFRMDENDVASIGWDQVIGTLPSPNLKLKGNRVFYKFPGSIDVIEKH